MCGGTIEYEPGATVGVCDSCGTTQTLPRLDDDKKANLYDRANHFRRSNDFDKAEAIYEQILNEDTTDAEAYWSLVLCRYGIEYVEDPSSHKRVPTVNRTQFTSIFDDDNYKSAIQYADSYQREIYESEAKTINDIQKGILAISQKEEPFDVFICYKETDNNGRRTPDSVLANDLYHQLTQEGFKVFFARITLEDKLGSAYEPYIFAALNSAKVMVVLGTKPEYFKAVWVKNEWSRYLSLVKQSNGKKVLIPAYRDMDPYDLPDEFSHLQAQDMSKLGFMQDLIRGIKKLTQTDEPKASTVSSSSNSSTVAPLLKRAFLFLEDKNWSEADEYFEKVLDLDPENAEAYLGKLMVELNVTKKEELKDCAQPFDSSNNYTKVMRFADSRLKADLEDSNTYIRERNENQRLTNIYNTAVMSMKSAKSESSYKSVADTFKTIAGFKDADTLREQCLEKAEISRKDDIYSSGKASMNKNTIGGYNEAILYFNQIADWKDSNEQIYICKNKISEIEAYNKEQERIAKAKAIKANKTKKTVTIIGVVTVIVTAIVIVLFTVVIPNNKYEKGKAFYDNKQYKEAYDMFSGINVKNSAEMAIESLTYYAKERIAANDIENACPAYNIIYEDDNSKKPEACLYYNQKIALDNVNVGDVVQFGYYEQDNDLSNGKDEIEWIVLKINGNRVFVVSKYVLDLQPYIIKEDNFNSVEFSWDTSYLNKWLNSNFINNAFSSEHKKAVDGLTLLTWSEFVEYEDNIMNNGAGSYTQYALKRLKEYHSKANIKVVSDNDINYFYYTQFLRKTTFDDDYSVVEWDGDLKDYFYTGQFAGIRPAMWITTN